MEGSNLITTVLENVSTVFNQAVTLITGNAVAAFFIGVPVIGAGIGLVRRLMHR